MAVGLIPGSTERITQVLEALFRGHEVDVARHSDIILFPAHPKLWADGEAFATTERTTQVDVRIGLSDGRMLIESFAGVGSSADERTEDALVAFSRASLHVLLCGLFGIAPDEQVECEEWVVGGRARSVVIGTITTRFGYPVGTDQNPDIGFFGAFEQAIRAQSLPPGLHWIRLYHCEHERKCLANEVLLNNEPWVEVESAMADFSWPLCDRTYDVRVFLILRDSDRVV